MNNVFYNIVSIVIGLMLIMFSISVIKKKKIKFGILTIIHAILFIFFGIGGFFLPEKYSFITILGMLALCILMAIFMLTLYKKEPTNK
ncbi:MAG: hypothetical protein ACI35S_04425 [Anaeroplasma sp.]